MIETRIDARMALARYESSFAAFGTEAHFAMKDVHVVKEYIDRLEAVVEKAADRIEQLEAALRECANQHVAIWSMAVKKQKQGESINPYSLSLIASTANDEARKALEGKDD